MLDYVGLASRENWIWYKPVYHVKCGLAPGGSAFPSLTDGAGNYCDLVPSNVNPPHFWRAVIPNLPAPPSRIVDDLSASAEMRFFDAIPATVDIAATLLEPVLAIFDKDPDVMMKLSAKVQQGIQKMLSKRRQLIAQGHTTLSAMWISWRWGMAPLVKDIKALVDLCTEAEKKLRWLKKVAGKPTDVQFMRKDVWRPPGDTVITVGMPWYIITDESQTVDPLPGQPAPQDGTQIECFLKGYLTDWQLDFGATGHILVNWDTSLDDLTALRKIKRALLGLTKPWNTVWELTPFSWLVDYFLSTRGKLERLKQTYCIIPTTLDPDNPDFNQGLNEIPLPVQLAQGHSWRLFSEWRFEFVNGDNSVTPLGSGLVVSYTRQLGLPAAMGGVLSFLTLPDYWAQFANLGAIATMVRLPIGWKVIGGHGTVHVMRP